MEIFSAFYTQFHDFFRFVDSSYLVYTPRLRVPRLLRVPSCVYRAISTVFFLFCVPCAKARDFALKCFLAIGRKVGIVFINLDIYVCTST